MFSVSFHMLIGYARVSSQGQSLDRQIGALNTISDCQGPGQTMDLSRSSAAPGTPPTRFGSENTIEVQVPSVDGAIIWIT